MEAGPIAVIDPPLHFVIVLWTKTLGRTTIGHLDDSLCSSTDHSALRVVHMTTCLPFRQHTGHSTCHKGLWLLPGAGQIMATSNTA